jgi:uncharacterized protein (DUF4415 family)
MPAASAPDPEAPSTPPKSQAGSAPLDLSIERLDAHEEVRWNGRPLSELSDSELAAALAHLDVAAPPPAPAKSQSQRNWLKLRVTWPQPRRRITIQVDEGVLDWFRRGGPGYQARMNAVLRAYVDAQLEAETRAK